MSVIIAAHFPWQTIEDLDEGAEPLGFLLSDTRVSSGSRVAQVVAAKQFRLARNLIVGYTSSNWWAASEALSRRGYEPGGSIRDYHGTRHVRRLGQILREEHGKWGGCTEVLAVLWPRGNDQASIYELMPPDYDLVIRHEEAVGIGQSDVLARTEELYSRDPFVGSGTPAKSAGTALASAFAESVRQVGDGAVGLPIEFTVIDRERMKPMEIVTYRKSAGEWEKLTADQTEPVLWKKKCKAPPYRGARRKATPILL